MRKLLVLILIHYIFTSCASLPEIVPGKGAVYGTITASSHKDIIAKATKKGDGRYANNGKVVFTDQMVNYQNLKEIFVCLLDPSFRGGNDQLLIAKDENMSHRSLAIAKGDKLWVQNDSSKTLTFFLAGKGDDIQVYEPIKSGERSEITVALEGDLELGSDENEALVTTLFSRDGLIGQQHSSGDTFTFENLNPGPYTILFWFWRLGFVEKSILIKGGENIELNQVLSVDKILESK